MKTSKYISLLLALMGVMMLASNSQAQVSATATVTLTVVPAPGMNFSRPSKATTSSSALTLPGKSLNSGIIFQSSSNVMVELHSRNLHSSRFSFGQGEARTFTSKELKGVSSVEIDYLGS